MTMKPRILYLHYEHRFAAGRRATAGNMLLAAMRESAEQTIDVHAVFDKKTAEMAHRNWMDEAISIDDLKDRKIDVIYCEGGPLSTFAHDDGSLKWKISHELAVEFVHAGGVIIVADIDVDFASLTDKNFSDLFRLRFDCGEDEGPIYLLSRDATGSLSPEIAMTSPACTSSFQIG